MSRSDDCSTDTSSIKHNQLLYFNVKKNHENNLKYINNPRNLKIGKKNNKRYIIYFETTYILLVTIIYRMELR